MPEYDEHAAMLEIREFWAGGDQSEEAAFDRWLAARDRENRAIGWDAAVGALVHEDGTPVEVAANINPYRGDTT